MTLGQFPFIQFYPSSTIFEPNKWTIQRNFLQEFPHCFTRLVSQGHSSTVLAETRYPLQLNGKHKTGQPYWSSKPEEGDEILRSVVGGS